MGRDIYRARHMREIFLFIGSDQGRTYLTAVLALAILLAEVSKTFDRVVLIEDTRELQCTAPNLVAMRTKDRVASLSDLVRSSLRLRPDRLRRHIRRRAEADPDRLRPVDRLRRVELLPVVLLFGGGALV